MSTDADRYLRKLEDAVEICLSPFLVLTMLGILPPLSAQDAAPPVIHPGHPVILEFTNVDGVADGKRPSRTLGTIIPTPGPLTTVFIYAISDALDLRLRVTNEKRELLAEDDDSGGGTTPYVELKLKEAQDVRITVTSKEALAGQATLHVLAARETDQTLAAVGRVRACLEGMEESVSQGRLEEVRRQLGEASEELLAPAGAEESESVAVAFAHIAYQAGRAGDLELSRRCWARACQFAERTHPPAHKRLQQLRLNLAATLARLGRLEEARDLEERVLAIFQRTIEDSDPGLQHVRMNLATTVKELGDLHRAKELEESVLEVRERTLPDDAWELQAVRSNYASTLHALGDLSKAKALEEKVVDVWSRTQPDDDPELQTARLNLAASRQGFGDFEGARELQEKALSVRTRTLPDDHSDLQIARSGLALTLYALGELSRARSLQEKVLEVFSKSLPELHPHLQLARLNLALTLHVGGDVLRAKALAERAFDVGLRTRPNDHPELQRIRVGLAEIVHYLGDLPRAEELLKSAVTMYSRRLPDDHPDLQSARGALSSTYLDLGNLSEAKKLGQKILSVWSELPDGDLRLQAARGNLSHVFMRLGELQEARRLAKKVLDVYLGSLPPSHPNLQRARMNLGAIDSMLGDRESARRLEQQALDAFAQSLPEDHPELHKLLKNHLWTLAELGETHSLGKPLERLVHLVRQWLLSHEPWLPPRQFASLAAEAAPLIATALSLTVTREPGLSASTDPGQGLFSLVETSRSAGIATYTLHRVLGRSERPGREMMEELREQVKEASARVVRLGLMGPASGDLVAAVEEKERVQERLQQALLEIPGAREFLGEPNVIGLAQSLGQDEAAVGFWRYQHATVDPEHPGKTEEAWRYIAFVLRPDGVLRRVDLGLADTIDGAIEVWRGARGLDETAWRRDGEQVRQLIFDPLLAALGGRTRLVVALHDALHAVALDALPIKAGYLGDHFHVELRPTLRELAWRRARPLPAPRLVAFGGIDYGARPNVGEGSKPAMVLDESLRPTGAHVEFVRGGKARIFEPLPQTREEVQRIAECFRRTHPEHAESVVVLTGNRASRRALLELAPGTRYLHLATHGYVAPEFVPSNARVVILDRYLNIPSSMSQLDRVVGLSPLVLCGLALAGANLEERGLIEGCVTGEELTGLDLTGCELVVLSACDTAERIGRAGVGIGSLQTALHAAGARSAITALWKVPDEATKDLMETFYRLLWERKLPKHRALWEAKRVVREAKGPGGTPRHGPSAWAGWVLTGDPE